MYSAVNPPPAPHPYGSYGGGGGGGGGYGDPSRSGGGGMGPPPPGGGGGGGGPPPWEGIPPLPRRFDDMAAMPVSELEVRARRGVGAAVAFGVVPDAVAREWVGGWVGGWVCARWDWH